MAQLIIPINKQVDISKGALMTTLGLMNSGDELIQGDSYAHRLNVVVMDGDAQADLSGQAIVGKFIRSDGSTVTVVGSASGNVASVDFPSFVYAYIGRLVITLSAGGTALTQIYATVKNGSTNVVVDPGNVLPNLDEIQQTMLDVEGALQEIETALAASSAATIAANEGAARANTAAASIENMTAIANTLTPGSQATAEVTTIGGHYVITFGIPQGIQGIRGTTTYSGTAITGTSTTPTAYPTGIASAIPGDQYYYNGIASSDIGNVYICTAGGDAQTALWRYDRNIRGAPGAGAVSTVNGLQPIDGNVALTGADIPVSGTDATKIDAALEGKQETINSGNAASVRTALELGSGAIKDIQAGNFTVTVAAGNYADTTVTFSPAFANAPAMSGTIGNASAASYTRIGISPSAASAVVRVYNEATTEKTLTVLWIAVSR